MKLSTAAGVCAFLLLASFAAPAQAQMCMGAPSFTAAPYQVGVAGAFRDGAQGVGASFAAGSASLFGGAALSRLSYSNMNASHTGITAFGGANLDVDRNEKVFVCPVALVGFGAGPNIGQTDLSTVHTRGGGSVGIIAHDTGSMMVVPTFGLSAGWQRVTASAGSVSLSNSDTYGMATLGVGFVFNERVGIAPGFSIPFSTPSSDVVFSLGLSYNFGR